eukprot:TRINITY_DN2540_c1_g1::TRINITY_DN2540_c1_g1_i3::g.19097::m.19097 TRINITY_DN2540_c1_g1::TRINITY_DN2540_c1_g1_i3::g.19097  ORF type:complete len:218 (+),score=31.90,sp/Q6RUV5/RAC1_RAT/36.27/3e-35,Ras/PF00071.17/6.5e-31,Miro/PF08477.8/9.6e-08,Arf/PF00025.16/0.0028 TRINITY_DN2540_c1_g1_i3:156-809(+)
MLHHYDSLLRIVPVGDPGVGKRGFHLAHTMQGSPERFCRTVCDNSETTVQVAGKIYHLHLWNMSGQEHLRALRKMNYPQKDIILLAFSVANRASFENIMSEWYPEVELHCPEAAIVLVGMQSDLRSTTDLPCVTHQEAVDLAKCLSRYRRPTMPYVECSALSEASVNMVMETALLYWRQLYHPPDSIARKKRFSVSVPKIRRPSWFRERSSSTSEHT